MSDGGFGDLETTDVPWGRYTYAVEGLATGCYLEGGVKDVPEKKRLRFRVELPMRCFVTSMSLKLSNEQSLHDVTVERTLNNADFDVVHDGRDEPEPTKSNGVTAGEEEEEDEDNEDEDEDDGDEDGDDEDEGDEEDDEGEEDIEEDDDHDENGTENGGEETGKSARRKKKKSKRCKDARKSALRAGNGKAGAQQDPSRKVVDLRRAADSLRITLTDIDDEDIASGFSVSGGVRVLTVSILGYTRGQTPTSKGLKVLLNVASKLVTNGSVADRAEVDGLLGLAFLANRRYRQAAELLRRAADLSDRVADEDRKLGFSSETARQWSGQLNLLAAHAFFEHVPLSNDGVSALLMVAASSQPIHSRSPGSSFTNEGSRNNSPRQLRNPAQEYMDLRTELLSTMDPLVRILVSFLADSESLAVRMASARMIEFVAEQLGCAISPHMSLVLNQVLRSYQHSKPFGARERPASNSFSYDSMEDCYERLIDTCCKMMPITEHSVLQKLFDHTLVPIFQEAFKEADYLFYEDGVEENCDEVLCSAIAQTLRVSYLVLNILEGDAHVPSSFVARILNMLISENGIRRTPTLLRRTALHTWDAVVNALTLGASGVNVKEFKEFLVVQKEYIGRLVVQVERPDFEYEDAEDTENGIEVFKEDHIFPEGSEVLEKVTKMRDQRTIVVDRFTLRRLLELIKSTCESLQSCNEDDAMLTAAYVVFDLQFALATAAADVLMSTLVDVSYSEACLAGNGEEGRNNHIETGSMQRHLVHICEVLELLIACFWAAVGLLPSHLASEADLKSPLRPVLAWCVNRMKSSAPPPGMLQLLNVTCKALKSDMNKSMHSPYSAPSLSEGEVTFLQIYRAHLTWLPQATCVEALDLTDTLTEIAGCDFAARDVVLTVDALCDQAEELDARADASLDQFATIIAESRPRHEAQAASSLKELVDPKLDNQRILAGFPKRPTNASFIGTNWLGSANAGGNPMMRSFYLHVVLASCFDKFDSLGRFAERQVGPSFMSGKLDAFVEHAVFLTRVLTAATKVRHHREYLSSSLGNIFGSCLGMRDHIDGRVRLSGFEVFAGALDILFLAQKNPGKQSPQASGGLGADSVVSVGGVPGSNAGDGAPGVSELPSAAIGSAVTELADGENDVETVPPVPSVPPGVQSNGALVQSGEGGEGERDARKGALQDINSAFADGGPRLFRADSTPPDRLSFEDSGWQMLCLFMTSSLGVGKYVDFVVQRACLEYLKGCLLNAMRGESSGASVLSLEHVTQIWDSVMRLVGSPWRTLNGLSCWVSCAVVNVGFYVTVTSKGRQAKVRSSQLEDFALNRLFPAAEKFLRGETRESRLWGVRLLEVYLRAREMNDVAYDLSPPPHARIMRQMDMLCHDWSKEVRDLSRLLRDMYIDSSVNPKRKASSGGQQSFTQSSLTAMKRQLYRDRDSNGQETGDVVNRSPKVELWFPPLPKPTSMEQSEMYSRTLEAFANTVVAGGEESEYDEEEEGQDAYDENAYDEGDQYCEEDEDEDEEEVEDEEAEAEADAGELETETQDEDEESIEVRKEAEDDINEDEGDPTSKPVEEQAGPEEDPASDSSSTDFAIDKSDKTDKKDKNNSDKGEESGSGLVILSRKTSEYKDGSVEAKKSADLPDVDPDFIPEEMDKQDVASNDHDIVSDGTHPSPARPKVEPDIDVEEKMPGSGGLRRQGSFTGRSRPPSSTPVSGEGQAPLLGRRRSSEVAGFENSQGSQERPSGAVLSAAAAFRRRSTDDKRIGDDVAPVSMGRRRQASMKLPMMAAMLAADSGTQAPQESDSAQSPGRKIDPNSAIGSAFLGLSPRNRVSRGVALFDDETDGAGSSTAKETRQAPAKEARLTPAKEGRQAPLKDVRSPPVKEQRPKASTFSGVSGDDSGNSSSSGGGRVKPRRLPRAPAFVKGDARLPRAASIPGVSSTQSVSASTGTGDQGDVSAGRPRVPRTKGNRGLRLVPNSPGTTELGTGKRATDRSNRFGKRDVQLKLEDDGLGLDDDDDDGDDLFGSFDPTLVEEDLGDARQSGSSGLRIGTPKGGVRRSLVTDDPAGSPSSGPGSAPGVSKMRAASRILDSVEQYSRLNTPDEAKQREDGK